MGEIRGEFLRVARCGRIGQRVRRQGSRQSIAAIVDQARGLCVRRSRVERGVRDDFDRADQFVAPKNAKTGEIRHRPDRQGLEPLELSLIVSVAIAGWIGRLCRRLEFDEGPGRLASAFERDVRPADAGRREFGNDDQFVRGNIGQYGFEKALKGRRQSLLQIARPRPAQFANAECIFND
jgi:hypothetical protein